MKKNYLFFLGFAVSAAFSLYSDTLERDNDVTDDDIRAIREWINTKRQVTVGEKGGALSISGEVHTEFQATNERRKGKRQRGIDSPTDKGMYTFDVEATLMLDYRTDRTWAAIRLKFDNDAGIFSGRKDKISLDRALVGVRMIAEENYTSDVIFGRRRMGNIFDSKVEFDSLFDGIQLAYDAAYEDIGNIYAHGGAFVIDDRRNQFGYVGEIGLLDVANTGFYTKYSLIDWDTYHGRKEWVLHDKKTVYRRLNRRFKFVVSQLTLGYRFIPQTLNKVVICYLAGLYNHAAQRVAAISHRKLNWGSYIGVSIGELKKKGDWAFDANYQLLAPQCVPDFDVSGIGLGNTNDSGYYTESSNGTGKKMTTRRKAGGNVNYRGYQLTLQYLLSNNITLFQSWQDSMTLYDSVGPFRHYKQYEIEFIYGF